MIRIAFILLSIGIFNNAYSQSNLVPNASFEQFTTCPQGQYGPIDSVQHWYSPTSGSPDHFNECNPNMGADVPQNIFGYQYAQDGVSYTGFHTGTFNPMGNCMGGYDYKEYISTQLSEPLVIGETYCASFYFSLADSSHHGVDALGMALSTGNPYANIIETLVMSTVVENPTNNFLTDKLNWTFMFGTFVADSAYNYLTIGNFIQTCSTNTSLTPFGWANFSVNDITYYYIDNVSLSKGVKCLNGTSELNVEKIDVEIYPNPTTNFVNIKSSQSNNHVIIYDLSGRNLYEIKLTENENFHQIDISKFTEGVYVIEVHSDLGTVKKRIVKN